MTLFYLVKSTIHTVLLIGLGWDYLYCFHYSDGLGCLIFCCHYPMLIMIIAQYAEFVRYYML